MKRYIATALFAVTAIFCKAQTFSYSNNHITQPFDAFVIGQVKGNIIAWCEQSKDYQNSVILVYDKNLTLLKKIKTNLLHSNIDPSPWFYHSDDSFYVAYQYRKGNTWKYKLAGFDSKGNHSSSYVLDSLTRDNPDEQLSYNICHSGDRKVICCVKTIANKKYNALNFQFTFLDGGILYHDSLFLSFDKAHDKMIDFLVDSNKNVSLLKTSNTDTGFFVSVVKKEFLADHFLFNSKKLASGDLRDGTSLFSKKLNQYIVAGVWENKPNQSTGKNPGYITGLYNWKINDDLVDKSGSDIILHSDSAVISQINYVAVANTANDFFGVETDSVPIDVPQTWNTGFYTWQGYSNGSTSGVEGSIGGSGGGFFSYIPSNRNEEHQDSSHYKANFGIVSFANNQMAWKTELTKGTDDALLTDLSNNKIVAGKKGIHIVRIVPAKKGHYKIEHVLINYAGKYERINTTLWDDTYIYLIPYAEETNDGSLIIPCYKNNRLVFAKMSLE